MGGAVGLAPEFLDMGIFQRLFGNLRGQLLDAPGGGAGQRLQLRRQRPFQFGLDVDIEKIAKTASRVARPIRAAAIFG